MQPSGVLKHIGSSGRRRFCKELCEAVIDSVSISNIGLEDVQLDPGSRIDNDNTYLHLQLHARIPLGVLRVFPTPLSNRKMLFKWRGTHLTPPTTAKPSRASRSCERSHMRVAAVVRWCLKCSCSCALFPQGRRGTNWQGSEARSEARGPAPTQAHGRAGDHE